MCIRPVPHHWEHVAPALEVIVREDRSAHDGKIGVGSHEVVGQRIDEVQQACDVLTVHVHGTVLLAHRDAVLSEIRVGAVLEPPRFISELDGDDAEILSRRMRALRLAAARPAYPSLDMHSWQAG